ncbi:MAG: RtcB family protein, partial [Clostridium sp.]
MFEINGKYATASVFASTIDDSATIQIRELCNEKFMKGSNIAIMPDVHAGMGCTIGTTLTITNKVVPNLVGVDIGCGVITLCLSKVEIDLNRLDNIIRKFIPSGKNIRVKPHKFVKNIKLEDLKCRDIVNINRAELSLGTLGGGNHFIEINKSDDEEIFLCVHSGSRHLGVETAQYYQALAVKKHSNDVNLPSLAYLDGDDFHDYIHDMKIIQEYASLNREAIAYKILEELEIKPQYQFNTIHNYIDTDRMILRKGAVSAGKNDMLLIPINMRDGSLICRGLSNPLWNYSAPHGAGRLMSRTESKKNISLKDFKESMKGIYSTTVSNSTLDEAPMAYKS